MTTGLVDRLDLAELTSAQIEPLEALMTPEWSDVWRELARSQYVTLLSRPGRARDEQAPDELLNELAGLAVDLTLGIAQDLGGTQYYIQAGTEILRSRRAQQVLALLSAGAGYADVARQCGLTEPHVRRIERDARKARQALERERLARAQACLDLSF